MKLKQILYSFQFFPIFYFHSNWRMSVEHRNSTQKLWTVTSTQKSHIVQSHRLQVPCTYLTVTRRPSYIVVVDLDFVQQKCVMSLLLLLLSPEPQLFSAANFSTMRQSQTNVSHNSIDRSSNCHIICCDFFPMLIHHLLRLLCSGLIYFFHCSSHISEKN